MNTEPTLAITKEQLAMVLDILKKNVPQYTVLAFGSRVKGRVKPYSDLDLAVMCDEPLSIAISAALSDDFAESDLPWKVDIVDWASTSESFRSIIAENNVVLQQGEARE